MDYLLVSGNYRIVAFAPDRAAADQLVVQWIATRPDVPVTIYEPITTTTKELTKTEEVVVVDEKAAKTPKP